MNKKNIAMILSVVMTASVMLAGCGKKAAVPAADSTVSSSATGETATGEPATPETSTETVTVDYGVGLKKNGYFKGVKAKKLVTLPADYANIQIPRNELDLKDMDASVTSTISQITSSYGNRVKVERSAQAPLFCKPHKKGFYYKARYSPIVRYSRSQYMPIPN